MSLKNLVGLIVLVALTFLAEAGGAESPVVAKTVLGPGQAKENLLRSDAWKPYEKGFEREDACFVCDNGMDAEDVAVIEMQ